MCEIMKVGVMSDSHGEINNLKEVARLLVDKYKVDVIVHLGDDYKDASVIEKIGVKLLRVPGVYSSYYQDRNISNRIIENFNSRKVLITHTLDSHENDLSGDLKPEEIIRKKAVDVILYGHTHIPNIEQKEGILYVNPGHLRTQDKKNYPPSFAIIDFNEKINVDIINLLSKSI